MGDGWSHARFPPRRLRCAAPTARAPVAALLLVLVAYVPAPAQAAGARDAATLGQGGATVAAPGVGSAFVDNPALVLEARPGAMRVLASVTLDTCAATTQRWGSPAETAASSPRELRALPLLAAWAPLGVAQLGAGIWVHLAQDERAWFPGQEAASPLLATAADLQRYGALRYRFFAFHYGLALAWRPHPSVAVGLAAAAHWIQITHARAIYAGSQETLTPGVESTTYDAAVHLSLSDRFVPEGRAGLLFAPLPPLRIGLAATVSGRAHLTGGASLGSVRGSQVALLARQGSASLDLRPPWSISAALGVDVRWLSLDAQITLLGATAPSAPQARIAGLLLRAPSAPAVHEVASIPVGSPTRPHLRLAAGLRARLPGTGLLLRAGYQYGQSLTDPAWRSAARVDPDAHVLSVGVAVSRGAFRLAASYAHLWAAWRGGQGFAEWVNPVDPTARRRIGSGAQDHSGDQVALSLTLSFATPR